MSAYQLAGNFMQFTINDINKRSGNEEPLKHKIDEQRKYLSFDEQITPSHSFSFSFVIR